MSTEVLPGRRTSRWREADTWVLVTWTAFMVAFAVVRLTFIGDGVRHLPPLVSGGGGGLGEARWILFPPLLYALVHPWVALGALTDVEQAARLFQALCLVSGLVYLVAIRSELVRRGIPAADRAAALALAGGCAPLAIYCNDIVEPVFPAAIAIAGLAWAGRRSDSSDPAVQERGVWVAAGCIAVAALLYQGVVLAIGLLPCFVPWSVLRRRRTVVGIAGLLLLVPVTMLVLPMLGSMSLERALGRALRGEENPLYRTYLRQDSRLLGVVTAAIAGPPQGAITLPELHGMRSLVTSLRNPATRVDTLPTLVQLALGWFAVGAAMFAAARRRDGRWLLAFATVLVLPVLARTSQYGYLKYYILLPALLALAVASLDVRIVVAAALGVIACNTARLVHDVSEGRVLHDARVAAYAAVPAGACAVDPAWGLPVGYRWRGPQCSILRTLAGGEGLDGDALLRRQYGLLDACLADCFCHAPAVYTDGMTLGSAAAVTETMAHFRYPGAMPAAIWLDPGAPVTPAPLLRYPAATQASVCASLGAQQR